MKNTQLAERTGVTVRTIQGYGFLLFIAVLPFSALVVLANIISVLNTKKCFYPSIPVLSSRYSGTEQGSKFIGCRGEKR